jgi:hypothetical protein
MTYVDTLHLIDKPVLENPYWSRSVTEGVLTVADGYLVEIQAINRGQVTLPQSKAWVR